MAAPESHVVSPEARYFKIKELLKDADALLLYALVAAYVLIPEDWKNRVIERLDDPFAITLLGVAGGGRFLVRAVTAQSSAKVEAAVQEANASVVPASARAAAKAPRNLS